MGIEWRQSATGRHVLHLSGALDFSRNKEFMNELKRHEAARGAQFFDLDLSGVPHLDTAGLGMLLILLDRLQAGDRQISLLNCSPGARQYLDFADFGKRFQIS